MSFAAKLIHSDGGAVRVITASEKGRDAWFVLKLAPERYVEYKSMTSTGSGNIRDYGTIVESGWGLLSESEIGALKSKYQAA